MAFSPLNAEPHGVFTNKETGVQFEFAHLPGATPFTGYPFKIWVGPDGDYRWGIVNKTVAYIVVDEGSDGEPVTEKWGIRSHKQYL